MNSERASGWARSLRDRRERPFVWGVIALTVLGAWARVGGLSRGSLFRDDAWVALTRKVPWHVAWHMVGTAPGFVLFEKVWVSFTAPSTWWAQIPTLVASIVAIPVVAMVARYFGLGRWASLLACSFIVISRMDVQYATHLKPYAHDLVAGAVLLAAAKWADDGRSAWPFATLAVLCAATSFTVLPLVAGCGLVLAWRAARRRDLRRFVLPGAVTLAPLIVLYLAVRSGISPRLRQSWQSNFVSYHSLHGFAHSIRSIVSGVVWGFADTTPHWHVPGFSKLLIAGVVVSVLIAVCRRREMALVWGALGGGVFAAVAHLSPLGTGRTDAYLYPALALLVASGVEAAVTWVRSRRQEVATALTALIAVAVLFTVADRVTHRFSYPGGQFSLVAEAAAKTLNQGGGVLVEGTARWPWTYYEIAHPRLVFSHAYNTGFAPRSDDARVVVMPGTTIEGGYNASGAVAKLSNFSTVLYVRTDDWPGLGDPLAAAFTSACFASVAHRHVPGFLLETLAQRRPCHSPTAVNSTRRH